MCTHKQQQNIQNITLKFVSEILWYFFFNHKENDLRNCLSVLITQSSTIIKRNNDNNDDEK